MKRALCLATAAPLALLILVPMASAHGTTFFDYATNVGGSAAPNIPPSGGPVILLPAAALVLESGILTYAILGRR